MLTKEYISEIKTQGNGAMQALVNSNNDNKSILFILENLGYLPDDFDDSWIQKLLLSRNNKIRLSAIKNIGKIKDNANLDTLFQIARSDPSTNIRQEAVSSIGRMRDRKTIDFLIELLNDKDPKIISQAIRGLLVFKGEKKIDDRLKLLIKNENEVIQAVIQKEYFYLKNTQETVKQHFQGFQSHKFYFTFVFLVFID